MNEVRLIDANALPVHLERYEYGRPCHLVYKSDIDSAPTVPAEVVRHGRWIEHGIDDAGLIEQPSCSECGKHDPSKGKYCSECGARMDQAENKPVEPAVMPISENPCATCDCGKDGETPGARCPNCITHGGNGGKVVTEYRKVAAKIPDPENRVLTLDEVLALPDGAKVWVEYKPGEWCFPVRNRVAICDRKGRDMRFRYDEKVSPGECSGIGIRTYGRWYRVWSLPQEPTQAEKDANPWGKGEAQ